MFQKRQKVNKYLRMTGKPGFCLKVFRQRIYWIDGLSDCTGADQSRRYDVEHA